MLFFALVLAVQAPAEASQADAFPENTAICDVRFRIGRIRARDIEVECEADVDAEGAQQRAYEMVNWRRDQNPYRSYRIGHIIETTLTLERVETDQGLRWTANAEPLVRYQPFYPSAGYGSGYNASCIVNYNIRNGFSRVVNSACNADRYEEEYSVRVRDAVRRWIFTDGEDVDCAQVYFEFLLQGAEPLPAPGAPPCPAEEAE